MKILSNPLRAINSRHINGSQFQAWPHLRRTRQNAQDGETPRLSERNRAIIHIVKMCILLLLWLGCTVIVFVFAAEEKPLNTMVTVMPNQTVLRKVDLPHNGVRVTLLGPVDWELMRFPEEDNGVYGAGLRLEWRNSDLNVTYRRTDMWNIVMASDGTSYNEVSKNFRMHHQADRQAVISLESKQDSPVSLHMVVNNNPLITDMCVLYAGLLILGLYMLIIFDIIDHTFAALIIATTAIAVLGILEHRPNVHTIISFVNFESLMLLFGLMTIVDIMATTGVFEYLVVGTYRISRGRPWPLIFFLSMLTAFLSAFLNSDIMALVLTPITIRLCEEMSLRTTYVLVVVAIFADMGGALTPMGNPPNAIVTTNPAVVAEGVDFVQFVIHMLPGVLVAMFVVFGIVYATHRKSIFVLDQNQLDLMEEKKTAGDKKPPSQETLERIAQLKQKKPGRYWLNPVDNFAETLAGLEEGNRIRDKPLLIKCCIALIFALLCMILHSIPTVADGASLGWVTLLAAFLLIILDDKNDLNATLGIIQWIILLFIAALFVLSEAVDQLGLFEWIGDRTVVLLTSLEPQHQTAVTTMVLLWTTALLTIFIDNAAVTIFMLKFSFQMASKDDIPLPPMFWALTFGACFGGNGSLFGAVSNEIIALIALQHGYKISFWHFFVIGFPLMLVTMVIGSAYLLIAHSALNWN
ncbi:P protein isoform X1 [Drosophila takahashii]|uniref:P protein isoform X1 n=2 Tax=Drosophila takahashii TaxID=29030 RepID=UPI001CF84FEB|nr:P protein [Drosophila takahashii]